MAGPFLSEKEMYDLKKSEERINALQKREGTENYHVHTVVCGCPCPTCGGWHVVDKTRPIPTKEECEELLKQHNKVKNGKNS